MPNLSLDVSRSDIESATQIQLLADLTKLIAETSGKPESVVQIVLRTGFPIISFGGAPAESVFGVYSQIGELAYEKRSKFAIALSEYLEKSLKIPSSKIFVTFVELKSSEWAFKGKLVSEL